MDDTISAIIATILVIYILITATVSLIDNRNNSNKVFVSKQFLINHKLAYCHPTTGEFILLKEATYE